MKYRHKLTILLVTASLVPMILLVLYSHDRMSSLLREKEMEDMSSILEQTGEGIDSQIEVFSSLLNYLTYSPDIEDLITEKNMDNYQAYIKYTEVADPLLSVPKSYHDAIIQIQLFAESIKVRHEYTLVPLSEVDKEWWYDKLEEDVSVQWVVDSQIPEIAAVRRIYTGREQTAVLCVTLDYNKIFQPFEKIISAESGGMILDKGGNVLFQKEMLGEKEEKDSGEAVSREFLESGQGDYAFVNRKNAACGWIFYLYKLQSAVDSSVSGILVSEIPLIAACVAIILVLGLSFSRLFTRKIEELTDNMNRAFSKGHCHGLTSLYSVFLGRNGFRNYDSGTCPGITAHCRRNFPQIRLTCLYSARCLPGKKSAVHINMKNQSFHLILLLSYFPLFPKIL